ncbi:sugar porter family MFS transporter [Terriglobus saanensis]|uniref:Sugar transporter n=1 Tax=Terriglobus saanensis (strain ATCC BAA-1853 / DSM 23119 / SP1PR4) TaxID=401053 RepID=E8V2F3_TERSS|nr:sugar porter family MFS transporter [Terriglobus saanensis]ADV82371.1 sugar transporter [Terriglobus saanensis SP1PR4]
MHGLIPQASPSTHTDELRMGYVWWIAIAAALGGLLFGYDWVVIGGAREFYEIYFHLTSSSLIGWANSCALLGCLVGSLLSGALTERCGRRPLLLASAVLFGVSSALTGLAHSFEAFIVWRIVGGVAIGLSSNVSPMYIAEISPAAVRGRLVTLNQFAIVVGILIAQIANLLIAHPVPVGLSAEQLLTTWNVQWGWRWMFIAIVLPSIIFTVCTLFLPESPRWLLKRGYTDRARKTLTRIGGTAYAEAEISAIAKSVQSLEAERSSWFELFKPGVRKALWIAVALAVLQQWTGINILFNYAAEIYRRAGYGNSSEILLNIVITGAINLLFTVLAMFLVDTVGRRKLMLAGCTGIAASHLLCALAYRQAWPSALVLGLTLSAIACYAATLAPVTWVLIAEVFPNRVRASGVSVSVSALWIASFVLTYTFPLINAEVGMSGTFVLYGAICLMGFFLVNFGLTETKGRSLEEM